MIGKEELQIVLEYQKLPDTPEKIGINRQYFRDEINAYEFFCKAKDYLGKINNQRYKLRASV